MVMNPETRRKVARDTAAVAGVGCLAGGLWVIYWPLSLIAVGVVLIAGSVWGHARAS